MENTDQKFRFVGKKGEFFGIEILNIVFTFITLGLYYPWAKANRLKYIYGNTEFAGSSFAFLGTGKEMFKGFIKAVLIIGALYAVYIAGIFSQEPSLILAGALIMLLGVIFLVPVAIHGGLKYRLSRTTWRTVHMGYRGKLSDLMKIYVKGILLSIVTLGIYSFWFEVELRKYILKNVRLGNLEMEFKGDGSTYFGTFFLGYILSTVTLGIYSFWWMRDLYRFFWDNTYVIQDGREIKMEFTGTAGGFFKTLIGNFLIVVFTFGLGTPIAIIRMLSFVIENTGIRGTLNLDAIEQTEEQYKDATGEDLADMLEIDAF
ncbi:YjgN family protein [Sediminitomix flava]|uniref:Uncharacterized membrane protein YjgN (DUF898 family) n=1 Tax=Sediminitomix flava TaxID=379075 RepID=A0A315ZB86_SEDFL|nr:DUF898 family protein [Sediminitomix flava]PWJ42620.1 uncharacterized membrane protein YjgN (DUF898 family) [Sediminitomix flava]